MNAAQLAYELLNERQKSNQDEIERLREVLKEAVDEVSNAGGAYQIKLDSVWLEKAQDILKRE